MKKLLLPILLISSFCFTIDLPSHLSPKNTVIIFDFHNVLGYTDWTRATRTLLWDNPDRFSRTGRTILYGLKKLFHTDKTNESLLQYLDAGDTNEAYQRANLELVTPFWIDPQAAALVQKLKTDGYKLILFSNTPKETVEFIANKHPGLFSLFNLFDNTWARTVGEEGITKKSPEAFEQVKQMANKALGHKAKHYVFIDDTKKNIKLGEKAGIYGITFKSIPQTEKALTDAGILAHGRH